MSTMTAQFLVGQSHMYEGGIIPSYQLFLSENGRSAWILRPLGQVADSKEREVKPIVWVATLEHMAEEALVLIMLHVIQDNEACINAQELLDWNRESFLELYAYPEEVRKQLYSFVKDRYQQLNPRLKLMLNIFHGSSMLNRWEVLRTYPFEVEVTFPRFQRSWNPFSQQMMIHEGADV